MEPGPIYVYKCPNCANYIRKCSIPSGNCYEETYSDFCPEYPFYVELTKCKECNTFYWYSEENEVGFYEEWSYEFHWSNPVDWELPDLRIDPPVLLLDEAAFLEINEFFDAISEGTAQNTHEELLIRKYIWWAYNDRIRRPCIEELEEGLWVRREVPKIFNDARDELNWWDNVNKLKTLLDYTDVKQRILIAEMNRNLGDFENCINIIEGINDDDIPGRWKVLFINECKRKNKWVIQLD